MFLLQEEVDDCYEIISDVVISNITGHNYGNDLKRKHWQVDESSSDDSSCISSSSSSSSSHQQPIFKKRRVQEQRMRLPSLSRVFVDAVGSPH